MNIQEQISETIIALQEKGHILIENIEDNPDCWSEDEDGAHDVAIFAYSSGYHNGPVCKMCAQYWCLHCVSIENVKKCYAAEQQETR